MVSIAGFFSFFLVLQLWCVITSGGDFLAPFFDDVCKEVNCGQGNCKPSDDSIVPFVCECSPGWKQLVNFADEQYLKFLPCVIPNCTLNYSCSIMPSPVQEKKNQGNGSIFDVCRWTDCGGGKCESTSPFTHKCECREGYHNLLNLTFAPCFKECSLGSDCKDLGIGFMNESTPSLPPISSVDPPNHDDVCKDVNCGQGNCKPSDNSTIPYECECSPGWKQLANSDDEQYLKFLPCVIPNCTLNYSCSKTPSPVQDKENQWNGSIFDVCRWVDCGGGKCESTSPFTHKCECSEGYRNLLNLTFSPCFRECSLGLDCKELGIGFMNQSTPSPSPISSADHSSQASFRLKGNFHWLMVFSWSYWLFSGLL